MASYIPFLNSLSDCDRLKRFYADSDMIRVSLESIKTLRSNLPKKPSLWIDPAVDGYHQLLTNMRDWEDLEYIHDFEENQLLADKDFVKKPDSGKLSIFVKDILGKCLEFKPEWITVPQLPIVNDTSRNQINRELSKAASAWREDSGFEGKFILPMIFTHRDQLKGKTEWAKKMKLAKACSDGSEADFIWAVDSSLSDQKGTGTFEKRFQSLIKFHEDLRRTFQEKEIIAGPYWGMNFILWARGLCDYPVICLGTAYQYYVSGGFRQRRLNHIAIPPLRRWAVMSPDLKKWLDDALDRLSPTDQAHKKLLDLKKSYDYLSDENLAARQVAEFYKQWFDMLQAVQPAGRALALYQDLSSAYVLGKQLGNLPRREAAGRAPEKVAQQFMLNCL